MPKTRKALSKEPVVALVAVGLLPLLLEGALVQLLEAEGANKVFGMEFPEHGRDATTGNGFVASCAERAAQCVEVGLAVWLSLVLEEVAVGERLPAGHAHEAAWNGKTRFLNGPLPVSL